MDRAGLLEMIAGKTRSNTAAAILSNTKDLEEAYKSAMEAEGSALEENEKYLDSIQGRIDLFNAIHVISNVPVCACFGRLDVRQTNMAYYSPAGYSF